LLRVSTAWRNSAIRVSAHSRRPNKSGEFAATATIGPASTWARLYIRGNSAGVTWRWTWKLALQASSITESCWTISSSVPLIENSNVPPRRSAIAWLSAR